MSDQPTVDCGVCFLCGKPAILVVDSLETQAAVLDWRANRRQRPLLQDAFAQLPPGDREMILNGTHDECFDAAFKDE